VSRSPRAAPQPSPGPAPAENARERKRALAAAIAAPPAQAREQALKQAAKERREEAKAARDQVKLKQKEAAAATRDANVRTPIPGCGKEVDTRLGFSINLHVGGESVRCRRRPNRTSR
jgi:hypothetical protein